MENDESCGALDKTQEHHIAIYVYRYSMCLRLTNYYFYIYCR